MKPIQASFPVQILLAALIAAGGIAAMSASAMPMAGFGGKAGCEARQEQNLRGRVEERHARHMAALKEKLGLKPAQEAAWNTFAAAMQPGMRRAGADRQAMREEFQQLNTVERLDRMQAMAATRQARMTERAGAIKAFYAQLTPEQQKVFDAEAMPQRSHRGHHFRHHT